MATIFNTIKKTNGDPAIGITVTVSLSSDPDESVPVRDDDDNFSVFGSSSTLTDDDGYWSMDEITPNDQITPTGTLYKVVEMDSASNTVTYYVDIASAATASYFVGDILEATPSWES